MSGSYLSGTIKVVFVVYKVKRYCLTYEMLPVVTLTVRVSYVERCLQAVPQEYANSLL